MRRSVVLLSGGMDSTALAADRIARGDEVAALSVDYGQRHGGRELSAAANVADYYRIPHVVVPLGALAGLLGGSALTTADIDVPHGHYADESMRATVVPNRNAILLMVAAGYAAANGYNEVATAVHAGDHPIYPDCRPGFIAYANEAVRAATEGYGDVSVTAPFVHESKAWIAAHGASLGAPLHLTWSCYEGQDEHCGRCGTCVERREAFQIAGVLDLTRYRADLVAQ